MFTLTRTSLINHIRSIAAEHLTGDLIQLGHPLFGTVWINPERLSAAPCFYGTRVPIQNLFDFIEGGDSIAEFLAAFPGVEREQVVTILELARTGFLANLPTR